DWLFLSYITPLAPGDDAYAISLVVPMNAEGLRLYPRRPYAAAATSVFDYPLSARFDEIDTTVVFNDVFVPWEQVFIDRNVELVNAQFHDSPSHTMANFQSLVRFGVKLEFMAGLALRLAEVQGADGDPSVQATLGGDIAALCAAFDALAKAAQRFPLLTGGVARPHPQYVYAGMGLQRRLIVDLMRTLRELAGGAFQAVPSSAAAFTREETVDFLDSYVQGGITSVVSAGEGVHAPGRPHDAVASKALAIAAAKCFEHFHPNGMKVNAGSVVLEPGLGDADFAEMARHG